MLARILCGSGCVVFVVFACLQYNDPDALVWIATYALAAVACLVPVALPKLMIGLTALSALYLLGAFVLLSEVKEFSLMTEEVFRESLGLLLVAIWILACRFAVRLEKT